MDQLIPSMAALVEAFRDCFRIEVFHTFQILIAGWIVCLGPHTISEVWQATGLAAQRHHDTAYAVLHSAAWQWDDLGMVLATLILTRLIPGVSSGWLWMIRSATSGGQGRLRRHLPRRRALVQETQDTEVRSELGRLGYRCLPAVSQGSLLLPAHVVATRSQEGEVRASGFSRPSGSALVQEQGHTNVY
jgi:hypothetical protein